MNGNLNVIDQFLQTFIRYIDSGFGLLNGDVMALGSVLIGIDITLAGLFWAMERDSEVIVRLIKQDPLHRRLRLHHQQLPEPLAPSSSIPSRSWVSQPQVRVSPPRTSAARSARRPQASPPHIRCCSRRGQLIGFTSFFNHFVIIVVLLVCLVHRHHQLLHPRGAALHHHPGIQADDPGRFRAGAVCAVEQDLVPCRAGPRQRHVVRHQGDGAGGHRRHRHDASSTFTVAAPGQQPTIAGAMSLVLAAISLLGLGIFGPAIATGLVSGAPQLGAGAAIGTAGAVAGAAMLAGGAAAGGARLLGAAGSGGLAAVRAGTAMGSAASTAYSLGQAASGESGMAGVAAGIGGMGRAAGGAAMQVGRSIIERAGNALAGSAQSGREAAWQATGGAHPGGGAMTGSSSTSDAGSSTPPAWARQLQAAQRARHYRQTTAQSIKDGDRPGAPANPDLNSKEE